MLGESLWASLQPLLEEAPSKQDLLGTRQKPPVQGREEPWFKSQESKDWFQQALPGTVRLFFAQSLTQQIFIEHLLYVGHVLGTGDTTENKAGTIPAWRSLHSTGMGRGRRRAENTHN